MYSHSSRTRDAPFMRNCVSFDFFIGGGEHRLSSREEFARLRLSPPTCQNVSEYLRRTVTRNPLTRDRLDSTSFAPRERIIELGGGGEGVSPPFLFESRGVAEKSLEGGGEIKPSPTDRRSVAKSLGTKLPV